MSPLWSSGYFIPSAFDVVATFFSAGENGGWWDGADLTTMFQNSNGTTAVAVNGDPIGYWGDKSGKGNHMIQATAGSRPVFSANGVDFASSDSLHKESITSIAGVDMWGCAVVRMDTLVDGARIISAAETINDDFDGPGGGIILYFVGASSKFTAFQGSSTLGVASTTSTTATKYLVESKWDGANNTITQGGSAGTSVAATNTFAIVKLAFGSMQTTLASAFLDGQIAEIILIDRVPTAGELTNVRAYLNTKWSIP